MSTQLTQWAVPTDLSINAYTMKQPLQAKVISSLALTAPHRLPQSETKHILLHTPGLRYVSGQSVGVIPPGIDSRTNRPYAMRLYSIASCGRGDNRQGDTLSLVIARHFWDNSKTGETSIPGVCSNYLCDAKPGDVIRLTGPVGKRYVLPTDFMERDFVFIATGTGIAPFRAMLADLYDSGYQDSGHTATLVLGVPYADSILYDAEFKALQRHANFNYITAVSRGDAVNPYPDQFPTRGNKVYVHIALWHAREQVAASMLKPGTAVFMCGLKGMETGVQDVILAMGRQAGVDDLVTRMSAEGRLLREVY